LRVPYLAKLDQQIQPGQSLVVRGIPTGPQIAINLATGPRVENYSGDNIVLHISWREKEKAIVLNTLENGEWKKEERHGGAVIKNGEPFDLRVRAHDDHFELFVQHKKLVDFKYRLPLNGVTHVYINGDAKLQALAWEGNYYPMPYRGQVPGNFGSGKKLFISGLPDKDAKRMDIDLHAGGDIAYTFSVRFFEKSVVRNTKRNGAWETEERDEKLPFTKNKQFDLVLVNEGEAIQAYIDGEHQSSYKHRIEPSQIDAVTVTGDLQLQAVAFD